MGKLICAQAKSSMGKFIWALSSLFGHGQTYCQHWQFDLSMGKLICSWAHFYLHWQFSLKKTYCYTILNHIVKTSYYTLPPTQHHRLFRNLPPLFIRLTELVVYTRCNPNCGFTQWTLRVLYKRVVFIKHKSIHCQLSALLTLFTKINVGIED